MTGELNLNNLIQSMNPHLHDGIYVFCSTASLENISMEDILFFFREKEGLTVVMEKSKADIYNLEYPYLAAWITLEVHSSLEAVGFTAAFSSALSKEGISCNVVAGYFHDHIFVAHNQAQLALSILRKLRNLH
jgi:hypothetical protein